MTVRFRWCGWLVPAFLAAWPARLLADGGEGMGAAGYLAQLIGGLLIVIVAIVVLGWVLRRTQGGGGRGSQLIDVISVRSIGARERLMLVQVGEEQILVGVAPSGIRTLHTLENPVVAEAGEAVDFSGVLRRAVRGRAAGGEHP